MAIDFMWVTKVRRPVDKCVDKVGPEHFPNYHRRLV